MITILMTGICLTLQANTSNHNNNSIMPTQAAVVSIRIALMIATMQDSFTQIIIYLGMVSNNNNMNRIAIKSTRNDIASKDN